MIVSKKIFIYQFLIPLVLGLSTFHYISADCSHSCPPDVEDYSESWKSRMRLRALKNLDHFLNWSSNENLKTYALVTPIEEEIFEVDIPEMKTFVKKYGYYSTHPLVGKVTKDEKDLELICCLLQTLYEKSPSIEYLQIAVAEVITKALAYHDLTLNQTLKIPVVLKGKVRFEAFYVDHVFDIWHGMPAFGLVPKRKEIPSLLLFRGTDFSLDSQRGWASLMSDLDIAGPGYFAFQHSQNEIREWLKDVKSEGKAAQVLGFSLGGVLAAYTFIYENQWLAEKGSLSFCAPGIKERIIDDWQLLSSRRQQGFISYINTGDLTSKVGRLFGSVFALSTPRMVRPLTAHTILMTSQSCFSKTLVDVARENKER